MANIKGPDGKVAEVDATGRLKTFATSQPEDRNINMGGGVWSIYFTNTPTAANDFFFYLKNNGTKDLFITDIRISSSVATQIFYKHVSGTAVGGTAVTPVSRKLGSSASPTATIEQGVDITGLADLGTLFYEECSTVDTLFHLRTTSNIIIPQGQAVAFERVEATGLIDCLVSLVESE